MIKRYGIIEPKVGDVTYYGLHWVQEAYLGPCLSNIYGRGFSKNYNL